MFEIDKFSSFKVEEMIAGGPQATENYKAYVMEINKPNFHIKQVGIGSKLINDWTKAGLLNEAIDKEKWREFSLVEAIWIKFIIELRLFGVAISKIKEITDALFTIDPAFVRELADTLADKKELGNHVNEYGNHIREQLPQDDNELKMGLDSSRFSPFASFLLSVILMKLNLAYWISEDGIGCINLDIPKNPLHEKNQNEFFQNITSNSGLLINLKSLITKFFDNDKLDSKNDFYFGIMNTHERELIKRIRSGEYKQIIVKLEDGSITQFRSTKKDDSQLMMKIQRLLKRGDFKEIDIISRDGTIVRYEETDIVKMDTKK